MTKTLREGEFVEAFATLADTLVSDYDAIGLMQTLVESCQTFFDVTAAGILLGDSPENLELVASTSEATSIVELMQLSANAGPCIEAFTTGSVVTLTNISEGPEKWRRFIDSAAEQGFRGVVALPMRLRENRIGALNLLRKEEGTLDERDVRAAQALADVATIGILHERMLSESDAVRSQLQSALNSRVLIEQAKGVLAFLNNSSTDEAFLNLRAYARNNGMLLSTVAQQVVDRTLVI
ncbi:GAF and ANTAR domain-containing protein [Mycetocola zhujimingii]|uniref:GAF and ANTAR domain-containing protein n=1 Tax=Mycetocola zhujimingii TaxID=2079792 RepID=UPI000D339148|nr:GAF and ANTAR domain-containing protein [Mycetocola zhujimingii]AWB85680.1 transcriptional regulator [Mycetocola zhujimingii]